MHICIYVLIILLCASWAFASKTREDLLAEYHAKQEANLRLANKDALDTIAWYEYERDLWLETGDTKLFDILQTQLSIPFYQALLLYKNGDIAETQFKRRIVTYGISDYIQNLKRLELVSGDLTLTELNTFGQTAFNLISPVLNGTQREICDAIRTDLKLAFRKVHTSLGVQRLKDSPDIYAESLR